MEFDPASKQFYLSKSDRDVVARPDMEACPLSDANGLLDRIIERRDQLRHMDLTDYVPGAQRNTVMDKLIMQIQALDSMEELVLRQSDPVATGAEAFLRDLTEGTQQGQ
jgi:hypothetical protein